VPTDSDRDVFFVRPIITLPSVSQQSTVSILRGARQTCRSRRQFNVRTKVFDVHRQSLSDLLSTVFILTAFLIFLLGRVATLLFPGPEPCYLQDGRHVRQLCFGSQQIIPGGARVVSTGVCDVYQRVQLVV
jgi:hypothetical protein